VGDRGQSLVGLEEDAKHVQITLENHVAMEKLAWGFLPWTDFSTPPVSPEG